MNAASDQSRVETVQAGARPEEAEWTPGDGWREVDETEFLRLRVEAVTFWRDGAGTRFWVREEPVPPLPTEPYTVIYTIGAKGYSDWALARRVSNDWTELAKGTVFTDAELLRCIAGFKVLAEPRAVTARAVRDAFEAADWDTSAGTIAPIFRKFGMFA